MKIRHIWNVFKNLNIEKQFAFYIKDNNLHAFKISQDESIEQGRLNTEAFVQLCSEPHISELYIAHNHLEVGPQPSFEDFFQHQMLTSLCRMSGVLLKDYLIVSEYGYVSFSKQNLIENYTPKRPSFYSFSYKNVSLPLSPSNVFHFLKEENLKNGEWIFTPHGVFSSVLFSVKDFYQIFLNNEDHLIFVSSSRDITRLKDVSMCFPFVELFNYQDGHLTALYKEGILNN